MAEMKYLDFDLLVERSGRKYRALLHAPAGDAEGYFQLPFSDKDLEIFRLRVGQPRKGVRRVNSPEMALVQDYGSKLFKAVFNDELYPCFRSSYDQARSQGKGLRLRLRVKDGRLGGLPWEYLFSPQLNRFLSLGVDTPVVRYLELPQPAPALDLSLPLRVLAVIAGPRDLQPLDTEGEWQRLNQALGDLAERAMVQVEKLATPTLTDLNRQLAHHGPYHILHFIGHGAFSEDAQDGLLIFENELRTSQPVNGMRLGAILHNHPTLRLAVLNACEGARTSVEDPFAGVAHSLLQQGVPAVVAMQFEITDQAALSFSHEFYTSIACGEPLDMALGRARTAIFAEGNDIEWGTPVLFTRLPDGRIFDVSQAAPAGAEEQPGAEKNSARAQQAYEAGLSAYYAQDWERACNELGRALALQPDFPQAAEKRQQAEGERTLAGLYAQAQAAIQGGDFHQALPPLEAIGRERPAYRDAAALLEKARRQASLADLYADARTLAGRGDAAGVIQVFEQIHALDRAYPDAEGLLAAAQKKQAEAQRQARLEASYSAALRAMEQKQWPEARRRLREILALDSAYRDAPVLLSRCEAELSAVQPVAGKPGTAPLRRPRWMVLAPLALAGLALCGLLAWGLATQWPKWAAAWQPTPTSTAAWPTATRLAPAAAQPTEAPAVTNTPAATYPAMALQRGADMALIPAGDFRMGCSNCPQGPVHTVYLDAFYMDVYEVTNALYQACVEAGECKPPPDVSSQTHNPYYGAAEYASYPLINVSWDEAVQYCAWRGGQLPTEAQWEKAARGGLAGRTYPWGDEAPVCQEGATNGAHFDDGAGCAADTAPVGSYAANGYGLYDMAGNVWEWTADRYAQDYYSQYPANAWPPNPTGPENGDLRVYRGGSWALGAGYLPVSGRISEAPGTRYNMLGLRCAARPDAASLAFPEPTKPADMPAPTPLQITQNGADMALIPAGEFQMGSRADDALAVCQKYRSNCQREWFTNAEPAHRVYVDAFYLDVYEVTNALYQTCVDAGVCSPPVKINSDTRNPYYGVAEYANYPVVHMMWQDAQTFCQWRGGRLPTEAEWEKAARGGLEGMPYPWGDAAPACQDGAVNGARFRNATGCPGSDTNLVGSFAPNGYGLYDMAGNVEEWVADWYAEDYYSTYAADAWPSNPNGPETDTGWWVLRGGSWANPEDFLQVSYREEVSLGSRGYGGTGFRCARSITGINP